MINYVIEKIGRKETLRNLANVTKPFQNLQLTDNLEVNLRQIQYLFSRDWVLKKGAGFSSV
jgi:hypothetical protein